jgi:hypothetical protein
LRLSGATTTRRVFTGAPAWTREARLQQRSPGWLCWS